MPTTNHTGGPGTKGQSFSGTRLFARAGEYFLGSGVRHGTANGYSKHQALGESPCEMCRIAKHEYDTRNRAIPEKTKRNRLRARAQSRANTELRRRYPDEWKLIYDKHHNVLLAEAGLEIKAKQGRKLNVGRSW